MNFVSRDGSEGGVAACEYEGPAAVHDALRICRETEDFDDILVMLSHPSPRVRWVMLVHPRAFVAFAFACSRDS